MRYFDMTVLGKFSVVMADPPWDIHMEVHTLFHYSTIVLLFTHSHETKGHHHPSERSIYFNISYDNRKLVKAIFVISWFTANFSKLALFKCMAIGKENLSLELGTEIVSLFKFVLFPILYSYIFFMFDSPVPETVSTFASILKYRWYEESYLCPVVCFLVFLSYPMVQCQMMRCVS